MIRDHSVTQLSLSEFDWPFQSDLDPQNRWVQLAQCIPWDDFAQSYYAKLNQKRGRPAKPARLVIGALIIKHKLALSDRETVAQIQENPYLQYFVGLNSYQMRAPFVPSLFVDIRKRMGQSVFDQLQEAIIKQLEATHSSATAPANSDQTPDDCDSASDNTPPSAQNNDNKHLAQQTHDDAQPENPEALTPEALTPEALTPEALTPEALTPEALTPEALTPEAQVPTDSSNQATHHGKLILDATVAPQGIRYPTDLSLLNEARETTETLIDALYPHTPLKQKPRTYRQQARKAFLGIVKQRKPKPKARTQAIKAQLNYLRRNLGHIEKLLEHFPVGQALPLSNNLLYRYWVIQHLYTQQRKMFQSGEKRCDHRIVSISCQTSTTLSARRQLSWPL
jgi:hypothetical protein